MLCWNALALTLEAGTPDRYDWSHYLRAAVGQLLVVDIVARVGVRVHQEVATVSAARGAGVGVVLKHKDMF